MNAIERIAAVRRLIGAAYGRSGWSAPSFSDEQIVAAFADASPAPAPHADDMKGAAKSGDVALAGKDGAKARELLRASQAAGVRKLAALCAESFPDVADAIARGRRPTRLFSDEQRQELAGVLAATNATADLLGRSRVRERQQRAEAAGGLHKHGDDQPFEAFAGETIALLPPDAAVEYFKALVPSLSIEPAFAARHERQSFTLAATTEDVLLRKVKDTIAAALQGGASTREAGANIQDLLDKAGVSPKNPQYSEMVFRTNALDSLTTGTMREMRDPEVADTFPVWQYLGIDDERAGDDHRPKFGRYYPNDADFADVRGDRPYNCRCNPNPVDRFDWAERQASGARMETSW
jgi:hypothetical protein